MTYQLPIFPLPEAVIFPRTHLQLHVFEPRYLTMMDYVMAGEQKLALAHLREGYQSDYFGSPPVHRMLTACRVLYADRLSDGRWNILIEGVERAELVREVQQTPFRIAELRPVAEEVLPDERQEVFTVLHSVAELAETMSTTLCQNKKALSNLINLHQHPNIVCDIIASALVSDHYARQSLLAEKNSLRRLKLLNVQLQNLAHEMKESGLNVDQPAKE